MGIEFLIAVALWCGYPVPTGNAFDQVRLRDVNKCRERLIKECSQMAPNRYDCFQKVKLGE